MLFKEALKEIVDYVAGFDPANSDIVKRVYFEDRHLTGDFEPAEVTAYAVEFFYLPAKGLYFIELFIRESRLPLTIACGRDKNSIIQQLNTFISQTNRETV